MKKSNSSVRLASYIQPERYQITLKPDLKAFIFDGEEIITIALKKETKKITIHSKDIDIQNAEITQGKKHLFASRISYDEKMETAIFIFPESIKPGRVIILLVFRGILNDTMHGFYRSRYEVDGKEYHIATTQFEATDARRAFPCFDEPALKAIFEVKLIVPNKSTAISNTMPTTIAEHSAGYQIIEFSPTPKMSTYLVAFIVGDFEYIEQKTKEGVLVRVFVTPGKKHQAQFALDCAVKTLSFFTEYFGITYPLSVLDMIAIPDFSAGAMENWGAITYRESMLLIDPDHSSAATRQLVALVIAHEIAHQWFGNLVTMEWWTHLWLNEGFASYIEYLAVDHIFPDWNIWTQFITQDLAGALSLDALKHTHPIEVTVRHPDEISEIFDAVSYSKGASVIRMLAEYLGEKDFRDGLRFYLKKHSYKNTSTIHLWESFEKISKKPVSKMMKTWTGKSGYPILRVRRQGEIVYIQQERFFTSPLSKKECSDSTIWQVPLSISGRDLLIIEKFILTKKSTNARLQTINYKLQTSHNDGWIKLNAGESSVVRVNYEPKLWSSLYGAILDGNISPIDRLGLIRDSFDLVIAGELDTPHVLSFAGAYRNETDYSVLVELSSGLSRVHNLIHKESFLPAYKKFCLDIFSPMVKKVGWKKKYGESHLNTLSRSLILGNAGLYGDADVIKHARTMFNGVAKNKNILPADLRSVVYMSTARSGDSRAYEKLISMYKHATLHEEKNRISAAIGSFPDTELCQKALTFALSKDVRQQDTIRFIGSVCANPYGRELAWEFIKNNWNILLERYGGAKQLTSLVSSLGVFTQTQHANAIEKFFKNNPAPGANRAVQQALEMIRAKAKWLARDRKKIRKHLENRN